MSLSGGDETVLGGKWMFGNRVHHMLDNDYTPYYALDIFVKIWVLFLMNARHENFHFIFLQLLTRNLYQDLLLVGLGNIIRTIEISVDKLAMRSLDEREQEISQEAEMADEGNPGKGGYVVGAFNVYNLEGVEALVVAAEEEKSPAILQIHFSSLKQGGAPLITGCIAAAEQSNVPIKVLFSQGIQAMEMMIASL
ncbi:hypothetical protein MKX01_021236 [Papaver californicum]|nr:hypothetical protein MKX01_021236 [Papaver californicum]